MSEKKQRKSIKRKGRCLILASFSTDVNYIRRALENAGLSPIVLSDVPSFGTTIVEKLSQAISKADLVVAVLSSERSNSNIFYEVGFAHAMGKQVILIARESIEIPSDLSGLLCLRTSQLDSDALQFITDQIASAANFPPIRRGSIPKRTRPIRRKGRELLDELESSGEDISDIRLEQIIQNAIQDSGISVLAQSPSRDIGVDFAIWVDELQTQFGNPILVEVKKQLQTEQDFYRIAQQMAEQLKRTNARLAIVVYLDARPHLLSQLYESQPVESSITPVLFVQAKEFVYQLQSKSLANLIRELRNKLVHGVDIYG